MSMDVVETLAGRESSAGMDTKLAFLFEFRVLS